MVSVGSVRCGVATDAKTRPGVEIDSEVPSGSSAASLACNMIRQHTRLWIARTAPETNPEYGSWSWEVKKKKKGAVSVGNRKAVENFSVLTGANARARIFAKVKARSVV